MGQTGHIKDRENVLKGLDEILKGIQMIQKVLVEVDNESLQEDEREQTLETGERQKEIIDLEMIRKVMVQKTKQGKGAEVKELLNIFHVEKLSDITEEHFDELYQLAKKL